MLRTTPHVRLNFATHLGKPTQGDNMLNKRIAAALASALLSASAYALDPQSPPPARETTLSPAAFVNHLTRDNAEYAKARKPAYFAEMAKGQHPAATIVTCSDSRVQATAFDKTAEGALYIVRDIGNQMSTAEGSVEYGVRHLHTPLLMFIGHSSCDAIKAASGDYSAESDAIKRELDTIKIDKSATHINGVKANVNNQVAAAMNRFAEEIKAGRLTVVGAVFDIGNDMKQGAGRLNIMNVNGETDPAKLRNLDELKAQVAGARRR